MNKPSPHDFWNEIINAHIHGLNVAAKLSQQAEAEALHGRKNSIPQTHQAQDRNSGDTTHPKASL